MNVQLVGNNRIYRAKDFLRRIPNFIRGINIRTYYFGEDITRDLHV